MRITSSSYYNNIYGENNKLNQQLFDVNQQISSGQKIQYAYENPGISIDTLRLEDEVTTLTQVKNSAQSAFKNSTQTDTTIGEITKTLESMKVKLINAASSANSDTSTQAIAKELRGLENHLLTLANTSIGGQYLFSGTATTQKPIDANGIYQGNNQNLEAFLGSGVKQKYNISGAQLFSGEENKINRTITTNVPQFSLTEQYPDVMQDPSMTRSSGTPTYINGSSTIRDLMGDTDNVTTNDPRQAHFYIQGTKTDGTTFKKQINLNTTDSVDTLLQNISNEYGANQVNVNINAHGQIEIQDKKNGSSKLDFHMVGAIDFNPAGVDTANVTNIDSLQAGTNDFQNVVGPTATPNLLYVKEFTKSGFATPAGVSNAIEGINYDRTNFSQNGATLSSNISQIVKSDNSFALPSTKLIDVSSKGTLNTQQLIVNGKNIAGTAFSMQIDLKTAGSTFSLDGGVTNYSIFDAASPRAIVNADTMTYQQLMDVVNMATTNSLPAAAPGTTASYDAAVTAANLLGNTALDNNGKITFKDKSAPVTKAQLSIYDATSSNYSVTTGSALSFNANSSLTIRDPKTDFFAEIDEMIKSVEEGKARADGSSTTDPRNIGIQNAIQKIDDLADHVSRLQTEAGSYSQVLQASSDRSSTLIITTKKLQSDVMDTDVAEAQIRMQQLSLNYQALLSNVSKVSKLSLVNYL